MKRKLSANLKGEWKRSYCGPTALTIITGRTYRECEDILRGVKKRKVITGVSNQDLMVSLVRMIPDWFMDLREFKRKGKRPTLARWLRERKKEERPELFLVITTNHCLVVRGNKVYDNHFPNGTWLSKYNRRRNRVASAILLRRKSNEQFSLAV